jgi:hypothetical protein
MKPGDKIKLSPELAEHYAHIAGRDLTEEVFTVTHVARSEAEDGFYDPERNGEARLSFEDARGRPMSFAAYESDTEPAD